MVNRMVVQTDQEEARISRHIYGHFAEHLGRCIYGGIWVGEESKIPNIRGIREDVVEALQAIEIPVLRWPGGCFADEYHWREGIGPREERSEMINTHWGGVVENNHFGTHEFMDLCEMLDCEPYICGNVGSGTVREMQEWVEYITFDGRSPLTDLRRENGREEPWRLKYFGVGNENWGCGGNMRAEYYADVYRRYQTYVRNFGDNRIYKIACGPSGGDDHWTEIMMRSAARHMSGLALHYYCGSGKSSRSSTRFDEEDWFHLLKRALHIEELIERHVTIMDRYDPEGRVDLIVDEWGTWHDVEPGTNPGFLYQQNTLRDALVAGLTLNIFNDSCERIHMANIAQTVNVLQAVVLNEGQKMLLTPTYHVFEMYRVHQDAERLPLVLDAGEYAYGDDTIPRLSASASKDDDGCVHITLCNTDPEQEARVDCELRGGMFAEATGRVLTSAAMHAHNTFEDPDRVRPAEMERLQPREGGWLITLPAKSVAVVTLS